VLAAYHRHRRGEDFERAILEIVRRFLSGPSDKSGSPSKYWFETDSEIRTRRFARELEHVRPGLSKAVVTPLAVAVEERARTEASSASNRYELAPNLALWIGSLAGAVAVHAKIDETLAAGLLATVLLAFARLGPEEAKGWLFEA